MNRAIDVLERPTLDLRTRAPLLLVATMLAAGCPSDEPAADDTDTTGESTTTATQDPTSPDSTADGSQTEPTTEPTGGSTSTGEDVDPLERVYDAIGGREALESWSSLSLEVSGTRLDTGEAFVHDAEPIDRALFELRATFDIPGERARLAHDKSVVEPFTAMTSYVETIDGETGFVTGLDNVFGVPERPMVSARITSARRHQQLLNPHFHLRAVALGELDADVIGTEELDGAVHDVIEIEDALASVELLADVETGLIRQLRTTEHDFLLGDVPLVVDYRGWAEPDEGSLRFPADVSMSFDGWSIHEERRDAVVVDAPLDDADFELPADPVTVPDPDDALRGLASSQWYQRISSIGLALDQTQTFVDPIALAPGVHLMAGGTHNSLAIEMDSSVVLVEAPLYQDRSRALRDTLAAMYPAKPISHVVATHFHFDHLSGIRTFVSDGATIVGDVYNESYLESVAGRPHTLVPDELEGSGAALDFEPVIDDLTLSDATRTVEIYWVDNAHAGDMLMVYLPAQSMLYVTDLYSPLVIPIEVAPLPEPQLGWAISVNEAVELLGLSVQTVVGGHGGAAPYSNLLTHIGA